MTLTGSTVVVCRAVHQAAPLLDALTAVGAVPVHVPLIQVIEAHDHGKQLRARVNAADPSTWLAVTSANGVDAVSAAIDGRVPWFRVAVVGRATAERAQLFGWSIGSVAPAASAASLGATLPVEPGERVIAALADLASTDLADELTARGIVPDVVTAYRSIVPPVTPRDLRRILESDAVLITAPSVIQRLSAVLDATRLPPLIAIGPTSAAAIEEVGLRVAALAKQASVDGLIDAAMRTLGP